ncbi:EAL domain-containing protein [Roseospirillum parvum]|uniref:protein-glutamate O-methyltransferase n=1 Tax=Roseospirillum parvum TaxID=83401 RepID=A0A1G8F4R2_9PROT|nr:EAL domain-containing protein [Roseospirillum parvum]SDH77125.1 PAS domain S-box-containing protein/diguanylate cyclase (GGDEF) domain-containing protein [Roseospirillum parvum]
MSKRKSSFPIVGVGASAGGIAALNTFFDHMPPDSGMAFVVILHLDPSQASRVAEIIATHTAMPVVQAEQGMPVEPDRVYVIPPATLLGLGDEIFRLEEMNPERVRRRPVDHFFTAVAALRGERAVGVILSGTGSNGSEGIRRIKEAGGLIAVQDPETAEYPGMPQNAVATGLADIVLPVEALPDTIRRVILHDETVSQPVKGPGPTVSSPPLDAILDAIRTETGHEFQCYKDAMIGRRVQRRMGLKGLRTITDYLDLVRQNPQEASALARDLLINVTSFFRDPEAWEDLRAQVIAPMVAERDPDRPIRAWVAGCATGEEAYTLAMLLIEATEAAQGSVSVRIFATDASEDALAVGRDGVYPASVIETLPPARIERFFSPEDDAFRVRPILRDAITFAPQNLLRDPPFSRMDLIVCRNVLIYLKPDVQRKLLALFRFALRQGGALFLGSVETALGANEGFKAISKRWRIHRRTGPVPRDGVEFPVVGGPPTGAQGVASTSGSAPTAPHRDHSELARRALLDRFAPAAVLTDSDLRLLSVHGDTTPFLRHPDGEQTRDLTRHLRDALPHTVRNLRQRALAQRRTQSGQVVMTGQDLHHAVTVAVAPLSSGQGDTLLLITFDRNGARDSAPLRAPHPEAANPHPADDQAETPATLEQHLLATQEQLRLTVRQLEGANEDLKASNEEIMTMNEELQSTNEELESSKEELQSLNEELNTVNSQLQNKVQELESKSNDLNNLLNSTDTPTLFLDQAMTVRWFTPGLRRLVDLTPGDMGRPFASFARKVVDETFEADASSVLSTLTPNERQVPGTQGDQWFLRRILPYRTEDDRIEGIVVTYIDITERRHYEQKLQSAKDFAEAIVETVRAPLLILDPEQRVVSANPAFYDHFRISPGMAEGHFLSELGSGQWNIPDLHRLLTDELPTKKETGGYEVEHVFSGLGSRTILINAMRLDSMDLILLSLEDVTQERHDEARRRERETHQALRIELSDRLRDLADPAAAQAVGCEILARHLGVSQAIYAEITPTRDEAVVAQDWTDGTLASMAGCHPLGDFGSAILADLTNGRTVAVADVRKDLDPSASDEPGLFAARSVGAFLMAPLVKGDRLAGVFGVLSSTGPRPWSSGDVALVEDIATRIWSEVGRARAQEALQDKEERLRLAVDASEGGVFAFDISQDNQTFVSDRCAEILGVSPTEWPDNDHLDAWLPDRVHPGDAAQVMGRVAELMDGGTDRLDLDFRVRLADETSRWVRVVAQAARRSDEDRAQRITGILFDIDARKTVEERLAHLALHDPLTGLPNRSLFGNRLETALTQASRQDNRVALAMLDIDKFKDINDTLGHPCGDRLLCRVAEMGAAALRPLDTLARLGGDEFAVILPDLDSGADASHVLDRLLGGLDLSVGDQDQQVNAGLSLGVAVFPEDGGDPESLLRHADLALYRAKDLGGDQMVFFEPALGVAVERRRSLAAGLKLALSEGQFEVYYQPLLDLRDGRVVSTEALVRWNHPTSGLIMPDDFIRLAEETGEIIPLGRWVLDQAMRQARRWQDEGLTLKMAVNLSAKELTNPLILDSIDGCLQAHGMTAEAMELELTESALFSQDATETETFVDGARRRNFALTIDDFGTGFSAFSYLNYLPITKIKLDRSFIAAISDADHEALVGGLVDLGHRLGCRVTGEGVETVEQLRFLLRVGCDEAQGFLIAHPTPAGEVSAVVREINQRGLSAFLPDET